MEGNASGEGRSLVTVVNNVHSALHPASLKPCCLFLGPSPFFHAKEGVLALPVSLQGPPWFCLLLPVRTKADPPPQDQAEALVPTSTMLAAVPDWLAVQHNALSAACWSGFPWSFPPTAQHKQDEKEPWECLSRDLS